jgi:DNA polymerase (family 10)
MNGYGAGDEISQREGYFLEPNAHPERMNLNDAHCKMAKDMGVPVVISTDAHSVNNLDSMQFGVGQGRRG